MSGVLRSLDGLAKKIGSSFTQPPPPVVMVEASKPQSLETPRVDKYMASPKRDTEFRQPFKGKEIADFPEVVGSRPNQYAPRVSNMLPSVVQSAPTSLGIGHDGTLSSTFQNFRPTYNPLFKGQTTGGQGREHLPFWPHQQNIQGNPLNTPMMAQ